MAEPRNINVSLYVDPDDRELWEFLLKRRYGHDKGGIKSGVAFAIREIIKDEAMKLAREQMAQSARGDTRTNGT